MTATGIARRGVAIPETVLTIGFTMLILFGAIRLALVAYLQTQSDASAYIAAHTVAQNPQSSLAADQSYATSVIQAVFPHVQTSRLNLTTTGTSVSGSLVQTTDGLPVPGAPSTISLAARAVEPIAQATPGATAPYTFSITAGLSNYCATPALPYQTSTLCPSQQSYQLYVAQGVSVQTNGQQGINGRFTEWVCHSNYYSSVGFPAQRPQGGEGSLWDPSNHQSSEYAIYQWDQGSHLCR
ncbi:hypothetical protein EPN52_14200 [bacterium]|nr:MAG: hypothetical protein EPN52_14200 [bacterium]